MQTFDPGVHDPSTDNGWLDIPERHVVAAQFPTLMQAAPRLVRAGAGTDPILLYKAFTDVLGKFPDYPAQTIGECLIAGTTVMGDTIKPIEQFRVGDAIWTGQGKLSTVVSTRTIQTMKPVVKVITKGGLPITCTADHLCLAYRVPMLSGKRITKQYYDRVMADGGNRQAVVATYEAMKAEWVPAGELTEDHYLLSPVRYDAIPLPDDDLLARIWATAAGRRMLGYFVGDGSAHGGSAEFAVSVQAMSDALVATLVGFGFDPKVRIYNKETVAWRIRVHSREFVRWLRGIFYDADKVKVFPAWAVGDEDFLDGLCEADGCDIRDEHLLDSTSLSVVNGALASLRSLGFSPSVSLLSRSQGTHANAKPLHRIIWADDRQKNVVWRDDDYVCHRVKKLEFLEGPTMVYDIGVADSHHSFLANGFACHNCVSFGHGHANDNLQCVEIATGNKTLSYTETDTEFIYGESRKVGNMLGNQDGSFGSAAVKAMTTVGMVSRKMLGADGAYSGQRSKAWGRTGPPAAIEAMAAPYKLGNAALVTTWDELVAAIQNGYPVTICSNQGFSMTRDEQGFCRAQGHWAHCMYISAVRFDRPGACIVQSWGATTPSGPTTLGQPSYSFWADRDPVERNILGAGDSWALSKTAAFETRMLPPSWTNSDWVV